MAGSNTKSKDNLGHVAGAIRDTAIQHNKLVDDVAAIAAAVLNMMPGALVSAPAGKQGTTSALKWRTEAFSFTFRGKITAAAAQEKVFTGTTHDLAASKQAWYVLSVQTDGTTFTITKAADQNVGTDVYPTAPDNEIIVGFLKLVNGAGGAWVGNTDNPAAGAGAGPLVSATFSDNAAIGAAALLAAKVGRAVDNKAITT
jgi:hypothetical protein